MQNGGCIKDGVKVFFFTPNILKNYYLEILNFFSFTLSKNKTDGKTSFLKFKMTEQFNMSVFAFMCEIHTHACRFFNNVLL
jgi:hypothetical protein